MNVEMLKIGSSYQISIPILETYQDKYVRKFLGGGHNENDKLFL